MFIPIAFIVALVLLPLVAAAAKFAVAPAGGLSMLGLVVWLTAGLWPAVLTVGAILALCGAFPRVAYLGAALWGAILGLPTFLLTAAIGAPMWLAAGLGIVVAFVPFSSLTKTA
ncbi:hypothetical protein [Gordonia alkaliphila]|uniref:Uncharacterized protein n=1 Tax=Gordonia alkaliphila TaxID=1053547 RepID=A0ABP8ZK83_9ACTN